MLGTVLCHSTTAPSFSPTHSYMIDSLLTALTSHIIILLYMELSRDMPSKTDHLPSSLYVVVPLARPQSLLELAFLFEISS
jgi:hypothetical protein